ncbi:MAG TPA: PDZ domain-containing protein [Spirochaetota bacterium]|nr:PDZ domain-containing protein [Spirochaetota bacterium]HPS86089.1 PDZ domain-containing protein [Spirochaetota bacterium]
MKNTFLIIPFLLSMILIFSSCSTEKNNGILGIEVPIGNGKVSAETPYMISGVYEDTPAYKAGIKPGDLIIQVGEMPVTNGMKFDEIFSKHLAGKAGSKVTIYVKRGTENLVFEVVRAERGN